MLTYSDDEKHDVIGMARTDLRVAMTNYHAKRGMVNRGKREERGRLLSECKLAKRKLVAAMRRCTDLITTEVKACYGK